jgi:vacuolar-type H+-ATPase subunit E/Vma4
LSCDYLKTIEQKYNKKIAENILDINKAILEMKNFFFTDFFQSLEFEYAEIIGDNFDGYKRLVMKKIRGYLPKFSSNVKIRANMRDSDFIREELFEITKLLSFPYTIQVVSDPIETVGGFIMYDKEEKFFIDWRYETVIELNKQEIAKIIEKKFPFYIDKRDSALNIMEKCNICSGGFINENDR